MKKQAGLWIDHRKAVIVVLSGDDEEVKTIVSGMEKHVRFTGGDGSEEGSSEDVHDRQFGNHLNSYYDQVIAVVRNAESVLIFCPGEAKGELEKRLKNEGMKDHAVSVEAADKMTDRQIMAKVRENFSK